MPKSEPVPVPPNTVQPQTRAAWREWLETNHGRKEGVWLAYYKKAAAGLRLTYVEAVEEALCFGWIDSKANRLDDERTLQWFAPRRPGSSWAPSNKERVARLTAAGLMAPAGFAKVAAAQQDGTWNALDSVAALAVPPDLAQVLAGYPLARQHFDSFSRSVREGILFWIASAKRPSTRDRRLAETARLAAEGRPAHQ